MGILSFVKKQFIDILEWTEDGDSLLAWRFPTADREIQQGARLVVRETQMALFVDQGHVADVFGPGTHAVKTANLPVLTDLRHWDKLFESPFKSEVYFFSTRLRLNQTWGTANPLTIRDREFGAVRVRGFGVYSYRIGNAAVFYRNISGTRESYAVAELEGQLRSTLITTLSTHLGESQVPFLDMAANGDALGRAVLQKARPAFAALGLVLEEFQIQNVSLPEELQKRLDERIGMGIVGELSRYTQFQVAQSIPTAAAAPGGAAGAGVGLGAGIAMGQAMSQGISQAGAGQRATRPGEPPAGAAAAPGGGDVAPAAPGAAGSVCPRCQTRLDRPSKFCPECGAPQG
jgi:membrane protease subunit (stomatin/prohibitin family)